MEQAKQGVTLGQKARNLGVIAVRISHRTNVVFSAYRWQQNIIIHPLD